MSREAKPTEIPAKMKRTGFDAIVIGSTLLLSAFELGLSFYSGNQEPAKFAITMLGWGATHYFTNNNNLRYGSALSMMSEMIMPPGIFKVATKLVGWSSTVVAGAQYLQDTHETGTAAQFNFLNN